MTKVDKALLVWCIVIGIVYCLAMGALVYCTFQTEKEYEEYKRKQKQDEKIVDVAVVRNVNPKTISIAYIPTNESKNETRQETETIESTVKPKVVKVKKKKKTKWTKKDLDLLAKIAECEAGNTNAKTKKLIMMVVLNRVHSKYFPKTIEGVILAHKNGVYQFSPVMPGGSWWRIQPTKKNIRLAKEVMAMSRIEIQNVSQGALYFEDVPNPSQCWHSKNLRYLYQSKGMRFYKRK